MKKLITLEYKSEITYRLTVEANSKEEALEGFNNDEYDLNEAIESDSNTDWDNVKVVKVKDIL